MDSPTKLKASKPKIDLRYADLVFIGCYFVSGMLDSSAYSAWTCFVSMQTGNTVFLGLGASNQPVDKPFGWLKSLISIFSFIVGSFIFAKVTQGRSFERLTLSVSFAVQALCIIVAAVLLETRVVSSAHEVNPSTKTLLLPLVPLFLLAFQAGGQMAASRGCGFNELPTTVLTSVYYDISSDPKLTATPSKNLKRNRRMGAVVAFLVGAIVGGWCYKGSGSLAPALWTSAGLKTAAAVAWSFWRLETPGALV
ncbi:hypothetical protein V2G26_014950 [Clonostachys chloroleuca]